MIWPAAILLASVVSNATAATNTFTGQQGTNWHVQGNWSLGHYPTSSEDVVIPTGLTCIISSASAAALTVDVEASAVLGVDDGETLTIYGADSLGTVDSLTVDGTLYLRQDPLDAPGTLLFYILADGIDTITVGSTGGGITLYGCGTLIVDGQNAGMSFSNITFVSCGTIEVTDGLMEIDPEGHQSPNIHHATVTIDGGTFTCESGMYVYFSDITIESSGEMQISGDLETGDASILIDSSADMQVTGNLEMGGGVSDSTLTLEDGTIDVSGELDIWETAVTVKAGTLEAGSVDSQDCLITIEGGQFLVAGTFLADGWPEESSITVSGGELELNGDYTGTDTSFTISGGLLDINDDFSNTGSLSYTSGTITVAVNKAATFE
jgi:hypothetical protein